MVYNPIARNTEEKINEHYDEIRHRLQEEYNGKLFDVHQWFSKSIEKVETARTSELANLKGALK